jgi:putative Mg2+ transporter-C (MgtC) family protein
MHATDFDEFHEILIRLGAAMVLGGSIGVNRDLHRKPAGLRVLAMVGVGSALVTMLMLRVAAHQQTVTYDGLSRVVQGILQGIGFLGAGVIMRAQSSDEVHGLTTAASVWLTAILGVSCGLGQWQLTLATFVISVLILTLGRTVEKTILKWSPPPEVDHHSPPLPPSFP